MRDKKILVLGLGNLLLADEGFGVRALYYLAEQYDWPDNVTLIDGATQGLMLMGDLMDCDVAIILDIALMGTAPGTIVMPDDSELKAQSFGSMHDGSLADILTACELAGSRPKTLIFALEPWDYRNLTGELTRQAEEALPDFCEKVTRELAKLGVIARKKENMG